MAARWKQWRYYFKDMHSTGTGPQMLGGFYTGNSQMYLPKVYNIEMDPHVDLNVGGTFTFMAGPPYKVIAQYMATLKKYPNPPAPNLTNF
ncbi:MAG: hypothetical protein ACLQFM_00060 [Terriglobales bacterium]